MVNWSKAPTPTLGLCHRVRNQSEQKQVWLLLIWWQDTTFTQHSKFYRCIVSESIAVKKGTRSCQSYPNIKTSSDCNSKTPQSVVHHIAESYSCLSLFNIWEYNFSSRRRPLPNINLLNIWDNLVHLIFGHHRCCWRRQWEHELWKRRRSAWDVTDDATRHTVISGVGNIQSTE